MTHANALPTTEAQDSDTQIDQAIRLYRDLDFPDSRIAEQLIRSGYPVLSVHERFPDVPKSQLPAPPVPRTRNRAAIPSVVAEGLPQKAASATTSGVIPTSPAESAPSGFPAASHSQSEAPRLAGPTLGTVLRKVAESRAQLGPQGIPQHSPAAQQATAATDPVVDAPGVSFQYVPLIQCSFPHADPGEVTSFTRRNGWLELTLSTARPDTGLPYGVPARLLTIYCASEAIRTRSRDIYLGTSVHDFLRRLDIPITRGERGSLRVYANQLLRLVHCAVTIDENIRDASGRQGLHIRQSLFVEEARLWWDESNGVGEGSFLVLSSAIFQSILKRSAPLSTPAIKQLRKSPMDLDVYAWLAHRLFHLSKPSSLTWAQLSGQFGHSYGEIRYFRRFFGDSLQRVLRVYPEARIKVSDTGLMLLPSKPHVEPRPGSPA
jgi:replication initiator protein